MHRHQDAALSDPPVVARGLIFRDARAGQSSHQASHGPARAQACQRSHNRAGRDEGAQSGDRERAYAGRQPEGTSNDTARGCPGRGEASAVFPPYRPVGARAGRPNGFLTQAGSILNRRVLK